MLQLLLFLTLITILQTQITFIPQTPPPPPEMESIGTEPDPPSEYDDLFTYQGYFEPYKDDQVAFHLTGKRRRRHRINCGRDRKGRHCDFRRSHHQQGFYNKECIHYAGTLEIYGVWQCGSRMNLREGAIVRLMVELHELILKYKQEKNDYAMERFNKILQFNTRVYKQMKEFFFEKAKKNFKKVMQALDVTNAQIFKNFLSLHDMSKEIIQGIKKGREEELQQLKDQLQSILEDYPPPMSICENIHDCGLCTHRPGCIYCTEEQRCHEGSKQFGAYYRTCDLWVSDDICPENEEFTSKDNYQDELEDYVHQTDLDLSQKLYIAQKQREMVELKNQIEERRHVLKNINNMAINIRNRNIKLIDQFVKHELYEEHYLDRLDAEEAAGGLKKLMEEVDELAAEEEAMDKLDQEQRDLKKAQEEQNEQLKQETLKKRYKAIKIEKKDYQRLDSLDHVLDAENEKYNQEQ